MIATVEKAAGIGGQLLDKSVALFFAVTFLVLIAVFAWFAWRAFDRSFIQVLGGKEGIIAKWFISNTETQNKIVDLLKELHVKQDQLADQIRGG